MSDTAAKSYTYAIGRRKASTAQVRLYTGGNGEMEINKKEWKNYFPLTHIQQSILSPLVAVGLEGKVTIQAKVLGGGFRGQAESVRLGIARALIKYDENFRGTLKKMGLLTRDARVKERKKYGLKKARRAPQWSKR